MSKFTVILSHYKQEAFFQEALLSVFSQTFSDYELIFADDASPMLDKEALKTFVETNKPATLTNVRYIFNGENEGTVRTLKKAIDAATGELLLFFAADDKLANRDVLNKYSQIFAKLPPTTKVVATNTEMMDFGLDKVLWSRPTDEQKQQLSELNGPHDLFEMTCTNCVFGISSMAFRTSLFSEFLYLDETKYKYIEDWPLIIRLSTNGEPIHYVDISTMLHRAGGISNSVSREYSPLQKAFYDEDLQTLEQEVFPFLNRLPMSIQLKTWNEYVRKRNVYSGKFGRRSGPSSFSLLNTNRALLLRLLKNYPYDNYSKIFSTARNTFCACALVALIPISAFFLDVSNWFTQTIFILSLVGLSISVLALFAALFIKYRLRRIRNAECEKVDDAPCDKL